MKNHFFRAVFLFLFFPQSCAQPQPQKQEANAELAQRIDSLVVEDQKYRSEMTELFNSPERDEAAIQRTVEMARITDSLNMIQAKAIFREYGYPGIGLVGSKSAHNYWLLIQHCDQDPAFQEEVLEAMKAEVDKNNANSRDYAYLADRVKLKTEGIQVYGTQMQLNADSTSFEPHSLMEPEKVNERREAMGLGPIEEYTEAMNQAYQGRLKKEQE